MYRVIGPLGLAAACCAAFVALLVLAYGPGPAEGLDAAALHGFTSLQDTQLVGVAERVVKLGDPAAVGLIGLALAGVALLRRRPRLALGVIALLAVTSIGSQLLKALLSHPRPQIASALGQVSPAAFPSGHSTAAMALALAGVLVAPRAMRPLAAVAGGVAALGVGFSVALLGWHFPSDVVGGYLLAAVVALGLVAALQAANARWPERAGREAVSAVAARAAAAGVGLALLAVLALGGFVAVLALARIDQVTDFAARHTALVLVAPAMALVAVLVLAGVGLVARRR